MSSELLDAIARGVTVFDLSRPMAIGMAQSPNHPAFKLSMPRKHGDSMREDGSSAANDLLETGTHVGTHIDALGHVSFCGELHGGVSAAEAQESGRLSTHGVEEIQPIISRGVLLDIARLHGVESLEGGYEVTVADLEAAAAEVPEGIQPGNVILVRTGWGKHWEDTEAYVGKASGVPGVSESGAYWCASHSPIAVGGDSIAFECLVAGAGHALLPAHRVLLVEKGIYIMETMALEELSEAGHVEFLMVVSPLPLVGATGSPIRPLAVVGL